MIFLPIVHQFTDQALKNTHKAACKHKNRVHPRELTLIRG